MDDILGGPTETLGSRSHNDDLFGSRFNESDWTAEAERRWSLGIRTPDLFHAIDSSVLAKRAPSVRMVRERAAAAGAERASLVSTLVTKGIRALVDCRVGAMPAVRHLAVHRFMSGTSWTLR